MAGVKNRLKQFEQGADTGNMASIKPQTPSKPQIFGQTMTPALQKFMNKQNEALVGKQSQGSGSGEVDNSVKKAADVLVKGPNNVLGSGANAEQNEKHAPIVSVNKHIVTRSPTGTVKPSDNRRSSQVNVPDIFKQESAKTAIISEGRRGSEANGPEAFKPSPKNKAAAFEANSQDENRKPKPFVKSGATFPRPPPGPKPQLTASSETPGSGNTGQSPVSAINKLHEEKSQQVSPKETFKVKLPDLKQIQLKNTQSSVASAPTLSASPSVSSQPPSPPIEAKDFRNVLQSKLQTQPTNQVAGKIKPVPIKPVFPPTPSASQVAGKEDALTPTPVSSSSPNSTPAQHKPQVVPVLPTGVQTNKWKLAQELKRQNDNTILERKGDSKKFKKVTLEASYRVPTPPQKPALPDNIDLTLVKELYLKTIPQLKEGSNSNNNYDEEDGDLYDDGISLRRQSNSKHQSERISIIPDMTEEEEEGGDLYDDGLTPVAPSKVLRPPISIPTVVADEEMYVDAETERLEENVDELYEDEETFAISCEKLEEERKRRQKEEADAKKKEEKEKKEEEKKRKKEEKERAKKEKEEMQLRKKFNLTGSEVMAGQGIIKQDVKGGVLGGLSLKKGQTVTIIRLDNNPPNKWLIKSDTGMSYIDSSIIEVDPSIIRQAMANQARSSSMSKYDDEDQAVYDDVPQDGPINDLQDDEEIYEECP